MMWGYSLNWPSMTLMMLGSTLWIVFLVVLVWAVIRWLNHRTTSPTPQTQMRPGSGPTAREILSQRYARGELDTTTFEQMRERLEASDNADQRLAHTLIHQCPLPVLVLRQGETPSSLALSGAAGPFRTLVSLDGSSLAEAALRPAAHVTAALAATGRGALHLSEAWSFFCTHKESV